MCARLNRNSGSSSTTLCSSGNNIHLTIAGRQRGAKATLPAGTAYHNNCDTPITASKPVAASAVDIISDNKATMTSSRRDKSDKVESAPYLNAQPTLAAQFINPTANLGGYIQVVLLASWNEDGITRCHLGVKAIDRGEG